MACVCICAPGWEEGWTKPGISHSGIGAQLDGYVGEVGGPAVVVPTLTGRMALEFEGCILIGRFGSTSLGKLPGTCFSGLSGGSGLTVGGPPGLLDDLEKSNLEDEVLGEAERT